MQWSLPESPEFKIDTKVELSSKPVKLKEVRLGFPWTLAVTILMGDCLDPLQYCGAIFCQVVKSITNQKSKKEKKKKITIEQVYWNLKLYNNSYIKFCVYVEYFRMQKKMNKSHLLHAGLW